MNQTSINITLNSIKNIKPHTHSGLECILLLKGRLQVEINGDFYNMLPDDMILINHRDIHALLFRFLVTLMQRFQVERLFPFLPSECPPLPLP